MEEYIGRQKLPDAIRITIWSLFSILLLAYAISAGGKPTILYIVLVSTSGIIFGLSIYGVLSLVRDYKKTKSLDGLLKEIKTTYEDAKK